MRISGAQDPNSTGRVGPLQHLLGQLELGAAKGTAGTMKSIPRLMRMIESNIPPIGIIASGGLEPWMQSLAKPPQTVEEEIQRSPFTKAANTLVKDVQEFYPRDRELSKDLIVGSLLETVGGIVPTVASGLLGRLGKAANLASIAQSSTSAASGAADEANAAGRPDLAQTAFGYALPAVAATQAALGVPERLLKIKPGKGVMGGVKSYAKGTVSESGQEGLEQGWGNFNASTLTGYDPDREITEGVGTSMALGGLVGGPVEFVGDLNARLQPTEAQRLSQQLANEINRSSLAPDGRVIPGQENRWSLPAEQGAPRLGTFMDGPTDRFQFNDVEPDPNAPPYRRGPITDPSRLIDLNANPVPPQFTNPDPIIDRWLREQYFRRQEGPNPEKRTIGQEIPVLPPAGIPVTDREDVVIPFRRRAQQQLLLPETTGNGSTSVVDEPYDPNASAAQFLMDMEARAKRKARIQDAQRRQGVNELPTRDGPAEPMPVAWPAGSGGPPTRLSSNLPLPRGPMFEEDQNPQPQPGSVIPQQPATVADGSRTPLPEGAFSEDQGQPVKSKKPAAGPAKPAGQVPAEVQAAPAQVAPAPAAKATARPVAVAPPAPAAPSQPEPNEKDEPVTALGVKPNAVYAKFRTSKGSEYVMYGNGNTVRLKKSPGKGQGQVQPMMPVVFISEETFTELMNTASPKVRLSKPSVTPGKVVQIRPTSGSSDILGVAESDIKFHIFDFGGGSTAHPVSLTPKPGLHPYELSYNGEDKSTHVGNSIVQIEFAPPQSKGAVTEQPAAAAPVLQTATTPEPKQPVKTKKVSALRAITGQKPVGVPLTRDQELGEDVVELDEEADLKSKETWKRLPIEKTGKVQSDELTKEQIEWFAAQGTPKENTAFGRLHRFLTVDIQGVVDAALSRFKGLPSEAGPTITNGLWSAAIDYMMKNGDFDISKGKFNPARTAQFIAAKVFRGYTSKKGQATQGSASLDQPSNEDPDSSLGEIIKAQTLDPADEAQRTEARQVLAGILPKIHDAIISDLDSTDEMQAIGPVWNSLMSGKEVDLKSFRSPAVKDLIKSPAFRKKISLKIREAFFEMATSEEAEAAEFLHTLRHSATDATGPAMTPDQIRAAAEQFIGGPLPENIRIVTDTESLTPDGKHWDGRFISGPDGWVIELNSAFLHSPQQVQSALLHEGLHAVWGDPSVQKAWNQYRSAANPMPGYGVTEEEQIEEGVVSSIGDRWSSDRARSAWKKFTDAVWSAIKRVFGFNPPESELAKDILVASAMMALRGSETGVNGSTVTRYSPWNQVFKNAEQVKEALGGINLPQSNLNVIEGAAALTGELIPESIFQKLEKMRTAVMPNGAVNHVARIAARALGFMRGYGQLTQFKGGDKDTDIAYRSVLEADRDIFDSIVDLYGKLTDARNKLDNATKAMAKEPLFSSVASMTNAIAKNLSDGYRDYIAAERKLAGPLSTLNGQRVNALTQASKLLRIVKHTQPEALKKAIENIADHMPAGITDEAHLHAWLLQEKATGFPSFAPAVAPGAAPVGGVQPMNDALWEIMMVGDPANGVQPAILKSPALMGRLNDLRLIKKDKAAAEKVRDNFIALMKSLNQNLTPTTDKTTTKQFIREYSKWIAAHQAALTKATELNSDFKKAQDRVRGLMRAIQIAESVQSDPAYMATLRKAAEGLNQRARGIFTFGIHHSGQSKGKLDGTFGIMDPRNNTLRWLSFSPGKEEQARNIKLAEDLLANINVFINDPLSPPGQVAVYKETIIPLLEGIWMADTAGQMLQAQGNPSDLGWLVGAPFRAAGAVQHAAGNPIPGIAPRSIVFPAVGGAAGAMLLKWMGRTDIAANAIRNGNANVEFGDTRQRKLNMAAAEEHGFIEKTAGVYMGKDGVPASEGIRKWSMLVLNPIFASAQNPGQRPLKVGEYTPTGYKITKADMEAAMAQKKYRDYVQGQVSSKKHYQIWQHPVGREVGSRDKKDGIMSPGYFREQTEFGKKMSRAESVWSKMGFSKRFEAAALADMDQSKGGITTYDNEIDLLESNGTDFNLAVNGWWGTSNPEYWAGYKDKVQMQVAREMSANPNPNHTFTTIEEFQDYFGERRAQIINAQAGYDKTTVDAEKLNALDTLMADLRRSVMGVATEEPFENQLGRDAEGTGKPAAEVMTAKSELTTPRGRMVAHDSFYDYTITDDGQRMRFNAAVMIYFQKQELEVLRAVVAGLRIELDKMNADYAKKVYGGGARKQYLQDKAYRKEEMDRVKAGESITTRRNLAHVISMLEKIENGILNNMKEANLDDHHLLSFVRPVEAVLSVAKLLSLPVQYGNILSAAFLVPMKNAYTMNRGRYAVASALMAMGKGGVLLTKQLYRAAADLADSMGAGAAFKKNKKAWLGIAGVINRAAMKRREQMEALQNAGFAVPESWGQGWQRYITSLRLPETGGMVHPEGDITPVRNMVSAAARVLGIVPSALAFMGGHMTGGGELIGVQVQDEMNRQVLEDLKPDIIRAFEARAAVDPNWGDTTKPIKPFSPEELGLNDFRSLNELRRKFGSSGSIESIFMDFYKRAKAAGPNGLNEPLMSETLMRNVMFEMQKAGNIISDSGKADAFKRKGWAGATAAILSRFMPYPNQLLPWLNDAFKVDPRDEGMKKWMRSTMALVGFMLSMAILFMMNLGGRQTLTQMATGKVPTQSTLTSFMNDPSAGNAARTLVAGGAGVAMPFFGDPLNRLLSGQAQRPGMDLAQIVPGIGAAAEMGDFVRKVAQTRSIGMNATDLTKRLFPVTEMALNRLPGIREDLVLQNAGRAIRGAAPGDLELKSQGGGNSRLTPMTPYIRRALRSAVAGDQEGFESQIGQATRIKMDMSNGRMDEKAARKAVMASVGGRNPIRLAVGRKLEPDEEARLVGGMTAAQSEAYRQAGDVFARVGQWGGGGAGRKQKTPRTSRKGRTRGLVRSKRTTRRTRRKRSRIGW